MQIIEAAPAKEPKRRRTVNNRSYRDLFQALQRTAGWVAINPAEIAGDTINLKQTVLYSAARSRRIRIQTTSQDGLIYIRTYREEEATNA